MGIRNNPFKLLAGALLVAGLLSLSGTHAYGHDCCGTCGGSKTAFTDNKDQENTIVDLAARAGTFNTLVTAVTAAGLKDTLSGKGPFTVFAPSDEAFAKIPKQELQDLLKPENREKLVAILTYHVVPNEVLSGDVVKLKSAKTVNGQSVKIRVKDKKVFVDNAQVVKTDIKASNGVIHVIDSVILPDFRKDIVDTAVESGSFSTLVAAVKAAGLVDTLKGDGPFTVFAPTDEAFGKLDPGVLEALTRKENADKLKSLLMYHVVQGRLPLRDAFAKDSIESLQGSELRFGLGKGRSRVNDVTIVDNDLEAANGLIHVIEEVLIPPKFSLLDPIASSPRELIILSISRGVPLFNDGQPEACSAVYEVTIQALLGLSERELPEASIRDLRSVLNKASKEDDPVLKAWILRHALDNAYISLPEPEGKALSITTRPLLIDDFSEPNGLSDIGTSWRLFTDRVMGGVSNGTSRYEVLDGKQCIRMQGEVSLENNGGFVQIALPLQPDERPFDASGYRGIRLWVRGNGFPYYVHLRTAQNRLPWQYFSAPLATDNNWRPVDIPFSAFTGQSTSAALDTSNLKRIAVVGAKKAFQADIAVSRVELYL